MLDNLRRQFAAKAANIIKKHPSFVAWMKRRVIRGSSQSYTIPDSASLHPGYTYNYHKKPLRLRASAVKILSYPTTAFLLTKKFNDFSLMPVLRLPRIPAADKADMPAIARKQQFDVIAQLAFIGYRLREHKGIILCMDDPGRDLDSR